MKFNTRPFIPLAIFALSPFTQTVQAHGYVSKPESRAYLCKLGENTRCGSVQWEPQSVEGPDRYPLSGPADGTIAAAGLAGFAPLNEQTVSRWQKRPLSTGWQSFSWRFTAAHASRDFRYFITKNNWNPNLPISRAQFDSTPFCEFSGNNRQPPQNLTHQCKVPTDKQGYHLILAVWDVADTPMSFYNILDVQIAAGTAPDQPVQWQDIGDLLAERRLKAGDTAQLRFFSAEGELTALSSSIVIQSDEDGNPAAWTRLLAQQINAIHSQVRVGRQDNLGQISPVAGRNDIFAQNDSDVIRAELTIIEAPAPAPQVKIDGLKQQYQLDNRPLEIPLHVYTDQKTILSVSLSNSNTTVFNQQFDLVAGHHQLSLQYGQPLAGHYSLTAFFTGEQGGQGQQSFHLQLLATPDTTPVQPPVDGKYDYVFGEQIKSYKAGTKVLQPKDGRIYQCKPWPHSGFCVQWSPGATHFEPGTGSHWQEAWLAL